MPFCVVLQLHQISGLEVSVDTPSLNFNIINNDISHVPAGYRESNGLQVVNWDPNVDYSNLSAFTSFGAGAADALTSLDNNLITSQPIITLKANDTIYQWPASTSSPFLEPPATAFDSATSANLPVNITYSLCHLPPRGLSAIVLGLEPGVVDLSASGLVCSVTPSLVSTQPNRPGEAFLIEYGAVNRRSISATPKRLLVVISDPCQSRGESWCFDTNRCSVAGQCLTAELASAFGAWNTRSLTTSSAAGSLSAIGILSVGGDGNSNFRDGHVARNDLSIMPLLPPKDRFPPRIILMGSGWVALSSRGEALMFEDVPYGSTWKHKGATATDVNEYGISVDISSRVQSYGAAAIDTSMVTPPGETHSFAVQYTVTDLAGNAATPAWRLIRIVCLAPEVYCTSSANDDDDDLPLLTSSGDSVRRCTINGLCVAPITAVSMFSSSISNDGARGDSNNDGSSLGNSISVLSAVSSSSMGSSSILIGGSIRLSTTSAIRSGNVLTSLFDDFEPAASPDAPRIRLLGSRFVELQQNEGFDRCSSNASITDVCDRGTNALDPLDGNLDRHVTVCGHPFYVAKMQVPVPVLLACGISTRDPGTFNLTYTVHNSAGASASTWRQITVRPVCPLGERLCEGMMSCSVDGLCGFNIPFGMAQRTNSNPSGSTATTTIATPYITYTSAATSSSSASSSSGNNPRQPTSEDNPINYYISLSAVPSTVSRNNVPPILSLITSNLLPVLVGIKRGTRYTYCNGSEPTPDAPCELGALASDPDGGADGKGVNLTMDVVVCPPLVCLSMRGCSIEVLNSYRLSQRGLAGCGIDPLAPVGTTYIIDFWVWDSDRANTSVTRYVEIKEPCPPVLHYDGMRYELCTDPTGRLYCSPLPCASANNMKPPHSLPPSIALLADVVYVEYGDVPLYFLGPCKALPNPLSISAHDPTTTSCGAYALRKSVYNEGRVTITDLCDLISVEPIINCKANETLLAGEALLSHILSSSSSSSSSLSPSSSSSSSSSGSTFRNAGNTALKAISSSGPSCSSCPLDMLHLKQKCPPGTYMYRFSVALDGVVMERVLTVHVYHKSSIYGTMSLPYTVDGQAKAEATSIQMTIDKLTNASSSSSSSPSPGIELDILSDSSSDLYHEAAANIYHNLGSTAKAYIDQTDIRLTSARYTSITFTDAAPSTTSTTSNTDMLDTSWKWLNSTFTRSNYTTNETTTTAFVHFGVEVLVYAPPEVHEGLILEFRSFTLNMISDINAMVKELGFKLGVDNLSTHLMRNSSTKSIITVGSAADASSYHLRRTRQLRDGQQLSANESTTPSADDQILGNRETFWDTMVSDLAFELLVGKHRNRGYKGDSMPSSGLLMRLGSTDDAASGSSSPSSPSSSSTPVSPNSPSAGSSVGPSLTAAVQFVAPPSPPPLPDRVLGNLTIVKTAITTDAEVPVAGSLSAQLSSLQSLITSLESKVSTAQQWADLIQTSANMVFTEKAQDEAHELLKQRIMQLALELIMAQHEMLDAHRNSSEVILASLERQLSAATLSGQITKSDTITDLSDLLFQTEAIVEGIVRDTMVIEEGNGLYEYVWANCLGLSYTQPKSEMVWSFTMNSFRQPQTSSPATIGIGNLRNTSAGPSSELSRRRRTTSAFDAGSGSGSGFGHLPNASQILSPEKAVFPNRRLFRSLYPVGGVLLHTVRRQVDDRRCTDPQQKTFSKLVSYCTRRNESSDLFASTSFWEALFVRQEVKTLVPFGVDPVFLPVSSLYDIRLSKNVNQYYNTTERSGEVSVTGAPYSYFHRKVQGLPDGFPVVLPSLLTEKRLKQMLTYLKDSNFLDRYTRRLTAEMLMLSTELKVFGHVHFSFEWEYDGSIKLHFSFSGFPALAYLQSHDDSRPSVITSSNPGSLGGGSNASYPDRPSGRTGWLQNVAAVLIQEMMGMLTLTAVFVAAVAVQAARAVWNVIAERTIGQHHLSSRSSHGRMRDCVGDLIADLMVAGLMMAASAAYAWYLVGHASAFSARQHYQIYDNIQGARARWLLPRKIDPLDLRHNSRQAAEFQASVSNLKISNDDTFKPGGPGRYLLPDHPYHELDKLASVLAVARGMARSMTVYGIVQTLTLSLLIGRLLSALAFQGRVGMFIRALYHTVPPLMHLVLLLVVLILMLAAMSHAILGTYIGPLSTYIGALDNTVLLFLGRGVHESFDVLLPRNIEFTAGQRLAAVLVLVSQILLLNFMLINFIFSIIVTTFRNVRLTFRLRYGNNTLWQDFYHVLRPNITAAVQQRSSLKTRPHHEAVWLLFTNQRIHRIVCAALSGVDFRTPKRRWSVAIVLKDQHSIIGRRTSYIRQATAATAAVSSSGNVNKNVRRRFLDFQGLRELLLACKAQQQQQQQRERQLQRNQGQWQQREQQKEQQQQQRAETPTSQLLSLPNILVSVPLHPQGRLLPAAVLSSLSGCQGYDSEITQASKTDVIVNSRVTSAAGATVNSSGGSQVRGDGARTTVGSSRKMGADVVPTVSSEPYLLDACVDAVAEWLLAQQGERVHHDDDELPSPVPITNHPSQTGVRTLEERQIVEKSKPLRRLTSLQSLGSLQRCRSTSSIRLVIDVDSKASDGLPQDCAAAQRFGKISSLRKTSIMNDFGQKQEMVDQGSKSNMFMGNDNGKRTAEAVVAATAGADDEVARLLALYDALKDVVHAVQKWQVGVYRWQQKVYRQQNAMREQYAAITCLAVKGFLEPSGTPTPSRPPFFLPSLLPERIGITPDPSDAQLFAVAAGATTTVTTSSAFNTQIGAAAAAIALETVDDSPADDRPTAQQGSHNNDSFAQIPIRDLRSKGAVFGWRSSCQKVCRLLLKSPSNSGFLSLMNWEEAKPKLLPAAGGEISASTRTANYNGAHQSASDAVSSSHAYAPIITSTAAFVTVPTVNTSPSAGPTIDPTYPASVVRAVTTTVHSINRGSGAAAADGGLTTLRRAPSLKMGSSPTRPALTSLPRFLSRLMTSSAGTTDGRHAWCSSSRVFSASASSRRQTDTNTYNHPHNDHGYNKDNNYANNTNGIKRINILDDMSSSNVMAAAAEQELQDGGSRRMMAADLPGLRMASYSLPNLPQRNSLHLQGQQRLFDSVLPPLAAAGPVSLVGPSSSTGGNCDVSVPTTTNHTPTMVSVAITTTAGSRSNGSPSPFSAAGASANPSPNPSPLLDPPFPSVSLLPPPSQLSMPTGSPLLPFSMQLAVQQNPLSFANPDCPATTVNDVAATAAPLSTARLSEDEIITQQIVIPSSSSRFKPPHDVLRQGCGSIRHGDRGSSRAAAGIGVGVCWPPLLRSPAAAAKIGIKATPSEPAITSRRNCQFSAEDQRQGSIINTTAATTITTTISKNTTPDSSRVPTTQLFSPSSDDDYHQLKPSPLMRRPLRKCYSSTPTQPAGWVCMPNTDKDREKLAISHREGNSSRSSSNMNNSSRSRGYLLSCAHIPSVISGNNNNTTQRDAHHPSSAAAPAAAVDPNNSATNPFPSASSGASEQQQGSEDGSRPDRTAITADIDSLNPKPPHHDIDFPCLRIWKSEGPHMISRSVSLDQSRFQQQQHQHQQQEEHQQEKQKLSLLLLQHRKQISYSMQQELQPPNTFLLQRPRPISVATSSASLESSAAAE
ncbi:hypothetical protein Vafri_14181 [Volvox africanus]|uniref:Polycystin cation channel PKD1/PKD2 domain-containing protein n=1 Tax=Volvox africanus TaxID=51714 RepID=A0A8J4BI78_9CHLO|nr:hypothetical protein Vafri_14181 [Volvox africanus]